MYVDAAAGASDDFAKSIGIKYSYTAELRPIGGFILDESEIIPTGEEIFAAVKLMGFHIFLEGPP